jgi:hypothetical protein
MVFLCIATFYVLGDKLAHAYEFSRMALWILLGLAMIEVWGKYEKRIR